MFFNNCVFERNTAHFEQYFEFSTRLCSTTAKKKLGRMRGTNLRVFPIYVIRFLFYLRFCFYLRGFLFLFAWFIFDLRDFFFVCSVSLEGHRRNIHRSSPQ